MSLAIRCRHRFWSAAIWRIERAGDASTKSRVARRFRKVGGGLALFDDARSREPAGGGSEKPMPQPEACEEEGVFDRQHFSKAAGQLTSNSAKREFSISGGSR